MKRCIKMALKTKTTTNTTGLVFKKRGEDDKKRVMIYGNDGTGKSTYAETYCKNNGLRAVCIDVDDTNYTNIPLVEINTRTDITTFNSICQLIFATIDQLVGHSMIETLRIFLCKILCKYIVTGRS